MQSRYNSVQPQLNCRPFGPVKSRPGSRNNCNNHEAQFNLRKINDDDTRYWHIVSCLGDEAAERASPIIDNPPTKDKYTALKDFLVSRYGLRDCERAQKLFAMDTLGDRLPSELMDTMLRINGKNDPNHYLFKHLFLRALPFPVRQGLATMAEVDVYTLAEAADRIYLSGSEGSSQLANVDSEEAPGAGTGLCHISRRAQRPPPTWKKRRGANLSSESDECYYHRNFGNQARRCRSPCSWRSGNSQAGTRRS